MKIWEKFTGSYKAPPKASTPKIKKKLKKGPSSTITASTRASKKSSVRISLGRHPSMKSRDSNKLVRPVLPKAPSERIEVDEPDTHASSLKMDGPILPTTTKSNFLDVQSQKYERTNSSSSFQPTVMFETNFKNGFEDCKRDLSNSHGKMYKRNVSDKHLKNNTLIFLNLLIVII